MPVRIQVASSCFPGQLSKGAPLNNQLLRRSRIAFGLAGVCVMFLIETRVAHGVTPHPASPLVWAVLGTVLLLLASAWWRYQAARSGTQA
jgi:hypothetical protein